MICRNCLPGKCTDRPSESEPALLTCPACDGAGCAECEERGELVIVGCPAEQIGADVLLALEMIRLLDKGLPPLAGGALDQTAVFLDAARFVWTEEARWKAHFETRRG